ncbi:hypothetical protein BX661DRAFT_192403 [Kickxella alabastrina]|uniref:uncharacterized protein n=1 Tax=Kickxella alabastrina TaxID=61397 RepID=UPI002220EEC4|nr:uncharacterized protein BX661DRAFT_192403 [Kickxella alabastrina]KAI7817827.1 hypothetical protein BX661DRAFT_192403 [Kickxella alabastrina]
MTCLCVRMRASIESARNPFFYHFTCLNYKNKNEIIKPWDTQLFLVFCFVFFSTCF